ncbi:Peregrin [Manis javanica]|nr:Peregrin [Manis javanica]
MKQTWPLLLNSKRGTNETQVHITRHMTEHRADKMEEVLSLQSHSKGSPNSQWRYDAVCLRGGKYGTQAELKAAIRSACIILVPVLLGSRHYS